FDDFNDNDYVAKGTASWVKESLKDPKRKHCIGNHDLPYMLPYINPVYDCPGYTEEKNTEINKVLGKNDWAKLVPAVFTQGWLISHAGFDFRLYREDVYPAVDEMIEEANKGLHRAMQGEWDKHFVAGARMGQPFVAGITWADWQELIPIVGVPQIVGHTPDRYVRERRVTKTQTDYCIDTNRRAAIIIKNGKAEVVSTT
ncbi:hypothetical protein, partial [Acinetobacter sp.]|uniref:hypothetical protein n=1 Tax=Acinetobacter sp. TaxID=472 RepID=UPI00375305B3